MAQSTFLLSICAQNGNDRRKSENNSRLSFRKYKISLWLHRHELMHCCTHGNSICVQLHRRLRKTAFSRLSSQAFIVDNQKRLNHGTDGLKNRRNASEETDSACAKPEREIFWQMFTGAWMLIHQTSSLHFSPVLCTNAVYLDSKRTWVDYFFHSAAFSVNKGNVFTKVAQASCWKLLRLSLLWDLNVTVIEASNIRQKKLSRYVVKWMKLEHRIVSRK